MSGGAGAAWSADQQRWLAAMGYVLYRHSAAGPADVVVDLYGADGPVSAGAAVPAPGRDRLWAALRRAAAGREVADLVTDIEALRRDPALKRALWPKLRALRRGAGAAHRDGR